MSADETTDPALCWAEMTKAINKLSHHVSDQRKEIEEFLSLLPKIFNSLPQTLCSTPQWPDCPQLATRRRGFVLATVRRVLQLAVGVDLGNLDMEVAALLSLLAVLEDRSPLAWRDLVILLINFWRGLSEASQQDLELPGATQTMAILVTEDEGEEEVFNQDLKTIMLKGISMIERLQTLVSRVVMKQLRQFSLDITNLSTIQTIALDQLELGGAQLKAVTLELLTELHQVRGVEYLRKMDIYDFSFSLLVSVRSVCGVWRPSYWSSCWSSSALQTCGLRRWRFSRPPGVTASPRSSP